MKHNFLIFYTGCLLLFNFGCNNKYIDNIDRGSGYQYRPGYPELRLAATGFLDEDKETKIALSGEIVLGSLVFKNTDREMNARLNVVIQITEESNKDVQTVSREFSKSIRTSDPNIIHSQEVYRFEEIFEVDPGRYKVMVRVTDLYSEKKMVRQATAYLPDPEDQNSHITEIRILAKDKDKPEDGFTPVTTYDIAGRMDSLKFTFQVTSFESKEPLVLQSRLIKFKADTTVGRPLSYNNYSPSNITYRGIDFDSYEVIQSSRRLINQSGNIYIDFIFTNLDRGNYRLEVQSDVTKDSKNTPEDLGRELYKARDFSIKSKNYPSLGSPEELARPLYYLMSKKEYRELLSIESGDSLKKAIDRFWLSNLKNKTIARNVVSLYYERVEESNKQFSNFKEGWKTDPGMIYILFGPPWYVDAFSDEMTWLYTFNRYDEEKVFRFKQPKLKSKYFPYDNYLLQRNNTYFNVQVRQVNKWLNGQILKNSM